jgi:RNA polymerase sigma-70 factor (ECF subfamily)
MPDDLDQVLAGCRAGVAEAQRELYERYYRRVYRLAARMAGAADAADLAQEIFLRVFSGLGGFRGSAGLATWIYRVAANECLRHLRRPRRPAPLTHEPLCPAAAPERVLEQADLLERALEHLDPPLRMVFLLREAEELTYREIADAVGIPPGTVASQLSRARGVLQAFLRQTEQGRAP